MKYLAHTRIIFTPILIPWYRRVSWWFITWMVLSASLTVYLIYCMAKVMK